MFTNWVNAGGNLIAMDPDAQLASLLGINISTTRRSNGYLAVNKSTVVPAPASPRADAAVPRQRRQLITLNGATSLATLYSSATAATGASRRSR